MCACVCEDLIIFCSFDLRASDLGQKLAVFLIKTYSRVSVCVCVGACVCY